MTGDMRANDVATFLKILLRPSPGKVLIFVFLFVVVSLLPLYPTHVDKYKTHEVTNVTELEHSGLRMKSLVAVLEGGFNWTEHDITFQQISLTTVFAEYHTSYCDASPALVILFALIGLGLYTVSCYYIESSRQERKG